MRRMIALVLTLVVADVGRAEWHLQWKQSLPPRVAAWEHTPRMVRDTGYEVVPAADLALVATEFDGTLRAYDVKTGAEAWRLSTNGPIRYGAAVGEGAIVVGSEDGYLYCLEPSGKLRWKIRGGPRERQVIGHNRLISAWPISAKPVIQDGKVYFVAGYWPVDGVYHYAADLKSGDIVWKNSSAQYRPFGVMRIEDGKLIVDGHFSGGTYDIKTGSSVPASKQDPAPKDKTAVKAPAPQPSLPGAEAIAFKLEKDGRYFVSTAKGEILCYAETKVEPRVHSPIPAPKYAPDESALSLLKQTKMTTGWAIVVSPTLPQLNTLLADSKLHVIALEPDAAKGDQLRRGAAQQDLFGERRLEIRTGVDALAGLPPYIADLVVAPEGMKSAVENSVRPYGGTLALTGANGLQTTRRSGPLPGADDWRQEFHDGGNTLASRDKLIKAPLGVLWYGGEPADLRFYFDGNADHQSGDGINPQPVGAQVADGRMILQGPGLIGAFDIYTGRKLWETKLPLMYRWGGPQGGLGIHSKKHAEPWKYPDAQKAEVPGTQHCRASGFNTVSLPDGIFVAAHKNLLRLDPETGKALSSWPVPVQDEPGLYWGGLHAEGNVIVATLLREQDMIDCQAGFDGQGGDYAGDRMPMAYLVAIDKTSGKTLWTRKATWGFLNRSGVALSPTRVFAVDLLNETSIKKLTEAGRKLPTTPPQILALDLATGKEAWSKDAKVLARGLVYSAPRDILLAANRHYTPWKNGAWAKPTVKGLAVGNLRAIKGSTGDVVWEMEDAPYYDPHILLGDLIIDRQGVTYDLATGKRHQRTSPITGELEEWSFKKGGCNHLIACDSLVTWRCAVYDLAGQTGTLPLKGMDSGCTPTLIPAGGLINISNFGTHHKRNRMTSLALVHVPENEIWTNFELTPAKSAAAPATIKKAGFNFGAPGDRVAADGTFWLSAGPKSQTVSILPKDVGTFETPIENVKSFVGSTGIVGATDILVPLTTAGKTKGKGPKMTVDVTLTFVEPENLSPGQRVFSVSIGGKDVVKDLDIAKEAGGARRPITRTVSGIEADGALAIRLTPTVGQPVLSGVEVRSR